MITIITLFGIILAKLPDPSGIYTQKLSTNKQAVSSGSLASIVEQGPALIQDTIVFEDSGDTMYVPRPIGGFNTSTLKHEFMIADETWYAPTGPDGDFHIVTYNKHFIDILENTKYYLELCTSKYNKRAELELRYEFYYNHVQADFILPMLQKEAQPALN